MKYYTNDRYPKEKVYEDEKLEFACEKCKIKILEPNAFEYQEKSDQKDFIELFVDWFFSDWMENEEEAQEEDGQSVIDDLRYLDEVDRRLGL